MTVFSSAEMTRLVGDIGALTT
jgi:hypothetical protein